MSVKTYYIETVNLVCFEAQETPWSERKFTSLIKKTDHNAVVEQWRTNLEGALEEIKRLEELLTKTQAKVTIERRDFFAAHAMSGRLANEDMYARHGADKVDVAEDAAGYADALIEALNVSQLIITKVPTDEQTNLD